MLSEQTEALTRLCQDKIDRWLSDEPEFQPGYRDGLCLYDNGPGSCCFFGPDLKEEFRHRMSTIDEMPPSAFADPDVGEIPSTLLMSLQLVHDAACTHGTVEAADEGTHLHSPWDVHAESDDFLTNARKNMEVLAEVLDLELSMPWKN